MNINILIGNIIRLLVLPKILFYRVFYGVRFPIGSIIYWYPKIRGGKNIELSSWFQIGRMCRMNGKIKIWKNFFMNEFGTISAGNIKESSIVIWDDVMIGPLLYMISQDHGFKAWEIYNKSPWKGAQITIWNNVWIWARVTILKWVTIWDNVVIWAGSVVTKDISESSLAVWNPCKVIRKI